MVKENFTDRGIDSGLSFGSKVFHGPTQNIIAEFYKLDNQGHMRRPLYIRNIKENVYRRLAPDSDSQFVMSYFVTEEHPFLFVNLMEVEGNWHSIQLIDLKTLKNKIVLTDLKQASKDLSDRNIWISNLDGYDHQSNELIVTAGIDKKVGEQSYKAGYWVSGLNIETGKLRLVTLLTETFI